MSFTFSTATKVIFGEGALKKVLSTAKAMGITPTKCMVVKGSSTSRIAPLLEDLKAANIGHVLYTVTGEPTTEVADAGAVLCRESKVDCVIGMGGGSVVDTGKAIAMLATNGGGALTFLEVIGEGQPITKPSLPFIAIPTTAGTGSEVTRNAVMNSTAHKQKASLRADSMYPVLAVVDPVLTLGVPPAVTASTGLDAFTQCLEPLISCLGNPLCDAIAAKGLGYGARSLRQAYKDGSDIKARSDMALCSLFGGLALANAKLGVVHGFAGVLGGVCPKAPHGAICAALLSSSISTNVEALTARDPDGPYLAKIQEAATVVCGPGATVKDLTDWIEETCRLLNVPPLSAYGLRPDQYEEVVAKSAGSSSMKGNPITLTTSELMKILSDSSSTKAQL